MRARSQSSRWRLLLGKTADEPLADYLEMDAQELGRDAALSWLYERDGALDARDVQRSADLSPTQLTIPDWINEIHALFPKETVERLERDAVERFGLHEIVTNPDVLARIEPNETLLRAVLRTKHLMNQEVLGMARELVRKVVRKLIDALMKDMRQAFAGTRMPRRSLHKVANNFDPKSTVRHNLANYDRSLRRLYIKQPLFTSRARKDNLRWQIILLVDQSGSMTSSVIHAAVTAACFCGLPAIKTHLVAFDTAVVDLTSEIRDPIELLMKVQLGGGTHIDKAVRYAETLVENPRRTMVVLITDFYEGGDARVLIQSVRRLCEQGVRVLGLAALDNEAEAEYDRDLAQHLVQVGAHVGAMTPAHLVKHLAEVLR